MDRKRQAVIKDLMRRYVQGVIENSEIIWLYPNFTDEEFALAQKELDALAIRVGNTRTFASAEEPDHDQ